MCSCGSGAARVVGAAAAAACIVVPVLLLKSTLPRPDVRAPTPRPRDPQRTTPTVSLAPSASRYVHRARATCLLTYPSCLSSPRRPALSRKASQPAPPQRSLPPRIHDGYAQIDARGATRSGRRPRARTRLRGSHPAPRRPSCTPPRRDVRARPRAPPRHARPDGLASPTTALSCESTHSPPDPARSTPPHEISAPALSREAPDPAFRATRASVRVLALPAPP
ncbi:hypothetical protein B0H15DRAFT_825947, partial [Mycena belliarum]